MQFAENDLDNRIPAGHAAFFNSFPYTRFGYTSARGASDELVHAVANLERSAVVGLEIRSLVLDATPPAYNERVVHTCTAPFNGQLSGLGKDDADKRLAANWLISFILEIPGARHQAKARSITLLI